VAIIYNWWSLFVRLAHPNARLEAITSRPFLLSGVARKTEHAGQQHLKITPTHGKNKQARDMLTRVSALLQEWKRTAEQFDSQGVWLRVCQTITTAFTGIDWLAPHQNVKLIPAGTG
jgi:ABC-type enterochelin transport system substrate-binding protein